jgi:Tol biopolymer transport system component
MLPRTSSLLAMAASCLALLAPTAHAAFPGKNGKIAFVAIESGPRTSLDLINPDGSGRVTVHELVPSCCSGDPAWSADGGRLAFVDRPSETINEILTINADGGGLTQFTTGGDGDRRFTPSWSPDGTRIAHERICVNVCAGQLEPVRNGIFVADGITESVIVQHEHDPAWSPDGTKIAFVTNRHEPNSGFCFPVAICDSEIYTMNADGTGETRISNSPGVDAHPSWSPDGTRIAFVSARDGNADIYTMNADGTEQTNATNSAASERSPAWSPDGSKIVFSARDADDSDIYTINADGTGLTNVTNSSTPEVDPDWQPIPGPRPEDYRNAKKFCKAERAFLGKSVFRQKYGPRHALRNCVKENGGRDD